MNEPLHIISLGAGVQSSTMALMAAAGEITPMPTAAIFADTQDEPQSVYRWLDWLEKQLPFPTYRVTAGRLSDAIVKWDFTQIPAFKSGSMGKRQCTRHYKLDPIRKKATCASISSRVTSNSGRTPITGRKRWSR